MNSGKRQQQEEWNLVKRLQEEADGKLTMKKEGVLAVNKIQQWSTFNGFTFSTAKTSCIHFCRKRRLHPEPEILLGSQLITVVNEVKFLGITFDKKLTFRPHVIKLRKKLDKALNILKVLSNTSWGASRTSLLRVYRAAILSKMDYGCVIYGSARQSVLKILDPIHHSALRLCSGAFRTSPVESLYVECCEPPLDHRRHIGIVGNEKADIAAKEARRITWPYVPLPDIDGILRSEVRRSWQEIWNTQVNNKLHYIQPSVGGFTPCNFNRNINVKLVRLRIGHTYFTHRYLLHSEPAPICQTCNANFTVRHILSECEIFNTCRIKWFGKAHPQLHELLGDPPHFNLFSFVAEIGFMTVI
ncbi:hypothetical protein AVEN_35623-1 [Araneus ventricosus]|uniref:RNase H type-1 domain-containing protein n=1 Tax=Araneus ventricosus TaxID=182803 RepID=A0A4Y2T0S3_ARAVE|nr:hypothetical protein AVEN_35623-1 [Araneus ventricosus]